MSSILESVKDIIQRAGAGFAASQQGEYLHGWLPAMTERPTEPAGGDATSMGRLDHPVGLQHASHAGMR